MNFKPFAKKWKLEEQSVFAIYVIIRDSGGKYSKTSKVLKNFGIIISSRQLKYFYRKIKFEDKIDIKHKGKPLNYNELLKKTA